MPLFESKKAKNDEIRPVLDDESVSRDAVSAFAILEEKIGQDQIANANRILRKYKEGKANLERKIIDNEQWFKLRHWECMRSNNEEVRYPGNIRPE